MQAISAQMTVTTHQMIHARSIAFMDPILARMIVNTLRVATATMVASTLGPIRALTSALIHPMDGARSNVTTDLAINAREVAIIQRFNNAPVIAIILLPTVAQVPVPTRR
jgi:hypothetical protein